MSRTLARDPRSGGRGMVGRRRRRRCEPALLALEDRRLLATLQVINTFPAGNGSLAAVINTANNNGQANTITFSGTIWNTRQTITLPGNPLTLNDSAGTQTITGPAAGVTVSGGGSSRVFQINANVTA